MATANLKVVHVDAPSREQTRHNEGLKPLHRINTVRRQQNVSLRSVARRMGSDMATVRAQDRETTDMSLSDLYRWQSALEVPVSDLLVDPDTPLSRPVMERAALVKLMKTALALRDQTDTLPVHRLSQTLIEQLIAIMPELEHVTPWHSVGQRRGLDEVGRIAEQPISARYLGDQMVSHEDS